MRQYLGLGLGFAGGGACFATKEASYANIALSLRATRFAGYSLCEYPFDKILI